MRRRERQVDEQPPAHLLTYDPTQWLPLVDEADYDPEASRNIHGGERVGPPRVGRETWRRETALHLWSSARQDWCREHGWPDGQTIVDVLRETLQVRRDLLPGPLDGRSL